jgi:hypothetical protein
MAVRLEASHLTALSNHGVDIWLRICIHTGIFNLLHNIEAVNDFAKDNVLVVQERCGHRGDEKLASVAVWTTVLGPF